MMDRGVIRDVVRGACMQQDVYIRALVRCARGFREGRRGSAGGGPEGVARVTGPRDVGGGSAYIIPIPESPPDPCPMAAPPCRSIRAPIGLAATPTDVTVLVVDSPNPQSVTAAVPICIPLPLPTPIPNLIIVPTLIHTFHCIPNP